MRYRRDSILPHVVSRAFSVNFSCTLALVMLNIYIYILFCDTKHGHYNQVLWFSDFMNLLRHCFEDLMLILMNKEINKVLFLL